jgi:hypothetical protein
MWCAIYHSKWLDEGYQSMEIIHAFAMSFIIFFFNQYVGFLDFF